MLFWISILSLFFITNCTLVTQFKNIDQTISLNTHKKWEIYSYSHSHSLSKETNSMNKTINEDFMTKECLGARSIIYAWGETSILELSNLDSNIKFHNNLESVDILFDVNGIGIDKGLKIKQLFLSYPPQGIKIDTLEKKMTKMNGEYEVKLISSSLISSNALNKIEDTGNLSVSIQFATEGTDVDFQISCIKLKIKSSDIRIDDTEEEDEEETEKEKDTQIKDSSSILDTSSSNILSSSVEKNDENETENGLSSPVKNALAISFSLYTCLLMTTILTYIGIKKRMNSSSSKKKKTGKNKMCITQITAKHELYRSLKASDNVIQGIDCILKCRIDRNDIIKKEFELLKNFQNEEHIIKVISYVKPLLERPAGYYMKFTPLGNLYSFIYNRTKTENPFSLDDNLGNGGINFETKVSFFLDLCRGLESLHRKGVIHTNIIPSNVLIFPNTQGKKCMYRLKFCGFSKAVYENSSVEVDDSSLIFSLKYSPAEVFQFSKYTKASDVFSLMMMFYEIYEQKHPFYSLSDEDYKSKFISGILVEPPSIYDKRLEKFNGSANQVFKMPPKHRNNIEIIRGILEDV